jgi:hypothetical protein
LSPRPKIANCEVPDAVEISITLANSNAAAMASIGLQVAIGAKTILLQEDSPISLVQGSVQVLAIGRGEVFITVFIMCRRSKPIHLLAPQNGSNRQSDRVPFFSARKALKPSIGSNFFKDGPINVQTPCKIVRTQAAPLVAGF